MDALICNGQENLGVTQRETMLENEYAAPISSDERKGFTYLWSMIPQPFEVALIDPLCWDEFGGCGSADGKEVPPK